jgi:hypothetical protein
MKVQVWGRMVRVSPQGPPWLKRKENDVSSALLKKLKKYYDKKEGLAKPLV